MIRTLETAVAAAPDDVDLRVHLGRLLLDDERASEALDHAERALQLAPADLEALQLAADAALEEGLDERSAGYRRLLDALGSTPRLADQGSEPVKLFAIGGSGSGEIE